MGYRINEPDRTANHAGNSLLTLTMIAVLAGMVAYSCGCTYATDGTRTVIDLHPFRQRDLKVDRTGDALSIEAHTGTDAAGVQATGAVILDAYRLGMRDALSGGLAP